MFTWSLHYHLLTGGWFGWKTNNCFFLCHGIRYYAICRDGSGKMAATLKVRKWHAQNVCVRLVKGLHEPYQALPSASMGNGTINFARELKYHTGGWFGWKTHICFFLYFLTGMPASFHGMIHGIATAKDYQSAVRAGILAAGDNCSRGGFIGACVAARYLLYHDLNHYTPHWT